MSNVSIITLEDDSDGPDVMFLTEVKPKVQSDCIFIEEINGSTTKRTTQHASNDPINRNKRPKKDKKEQKILVKKSHTNDASTSTSVITEETFPPEMGFSCCVCYEPKSATFNCFYSTMCGHVYCSGCINKVMNLSKNCAVCRKKLTKKQYHRIFF